MGAVSQKSVTFGFCTKIEDTLGEADYEEQIEWPNGSFCIYQAYTECPTGNLYIMMYDLYFTK